MGGGRMVGKDVKGPWKREGKFKFTFEVSLFQFGVRLGLISSFHSSTLLASPLLLSHSIHFIYATAPLRRPPLDFQTNGSARPFLLRFGSELGLQFIR